MKAINFPQSNLNLAENQPQYETLPAYHGQLGDEPHEIGFVSCFEVSDEDLAKIASFRKIWYSQLTGQNLFQPMNIFVENDIFDHRPLSEQPQPTERIFTQKQLVDFANYYLSQAGIREVSEADIEKFLQSQK